MLVHCVPVPGKICSKPATFNVWFDGSCGLDGFMCDEHVAKAIVDGVNGYRVYQITALKEDSQYSIPNLQEGDCPSCAGTGRKEVGGMLLTCLACDGSGSNSYFK